MTAQMEVGVSVLESDLLPLFLGAISVYLVRLVLNFAVRILLDLEVFRVEGHLED